MDSKRRWFSVSHLFLYGAFTLLILGVLSGMFMDHSSVDLHFHDTYFVIAQYHLVVLASILFLLFSAVYYLYPKLFRRYLGKTAGYLHFFITLTGVLLVFYPMHYEGFAGQPRRYYDYTAWESFRQYASLNYTISIFTTIVFLAQLLFVFNCIASIFIGKRAV